MTPIGWEVTVRIPMRLQVLPNLRKSRFAHARVIADTRRIVGLELQVQARPFRREWEVMKSNPRLRLQVLQVRSGPKVLDDDNLTAAFKPARDAVATFFGIDDGRRDRWVWLPCEQQLGDFAVRIHIAVVVTYDDYPNPKEQNAIIRRIKKSRITPNVRKPR